MPWLSKWTWPLPAEDLLTYTFNHFDYDKDKPVSQSNRYTTLTGGAHQQLILPV